MTATTAPRRSGYGYIFGPASDSLWIIGCPLFALAGMAALWRWAPLSDAEIYAVLFAFVVTGHHMPGWLRAFGEPTVYAEHKARLWVSFLAVPAMIVLPAYYGLGHAALVVAATFDLWHVALQQHGFGRIYAAKEGERSPRSARIDLACVLVWYTTVVCWSDSWTYGIAASFRTAGLPWLSRMEPATWHAVKLGLLGASGLLLLLYLDQARRLWRAERVVAVRKHVLHGLAFAVLAWSYQDPSWYRAQSVQNLFHALQYFFIVWAFSRLSVDRNPEQPRTFYRVLFQQRWGVLLYLGAIALYGWGGWSLEAYSERFPGRPADSRMVQVLGAIGLASLLLHFYVDSFIWKVRTRHVQQALDIDGAGQVAGSARQLRGAAHALCYFGAPLLLVYLAGSTSRDAVTLETLRHEARLYPRSAQARYFHGVKAMYVGDRATARRELEAALRLAPSKEGPAFYLARLDAQEGRRELELVHLRAVVRASPNKAPFQQKLAWALAARGRTDEAAHHLRRAMALQPRSADAVLELAKLYQFHLDQPARAVPLLRRALELDPSSSPAACGLAEVRVRLGQRRIATDELRAFLQRNPGDGNVRSLLESLAR